MTNRKGRKKMFKYEGYYLYLCKLLEEESNRLIRETLNFDIVLKKARAQLALEQFKQNDSFFIERTVNAL